MWWAKMHNGKGAERLSSNLDLRNLALVGYHEFRRKAREGRRTTTNWVVRQVLRSEDSSTLACIRESNQDSSEFRFNPRRVRLSLKWALNYCHSLTDTRLDCAWNDYWWYRIDHKTAFALSCRGRMHGTPTTDWLTPAFINGNLTEWCHAVSDKPRSAT